MKSINYTYISILLLLTIISVFLVYDVYDSFSEPMPVYACDQVSPSCGCYLSSYNCVGNGSSWVNDGYCSSGGLRWVNYNGGVVNNYTYGKVTYGIVHIACGSIPAYPICGGSTCTP